jgi:hypothetical protein
MDMQVKAKVATGKMPGIPIPNYGKAAHLRLNGIEI